MIISPFNKNLLIPLPKKLIIKLYLKSHMANILKRIQMDTFPCKSSAVQAVTYVCKFPSNSYLSHIARFKQKKVSSFTEETLIFAN